MATKTQQDTASQPAQKAKAINITTMQTIKFCPAHPGQRLRKIFGCSQCGWKGVNDVGTLATRTERKMLRGR